uniref:ABC transporter substrate-binding protein n=1 Tax=uncultured Sphingomonas sp. TaxID=158754 RepID=UPI0035CA263E
MLDGRVAIAGFDSSVACVEPQTLFRQTLRDRTFDVAELSMGSHIASVAAGDRHYVGVPVFLSRSFRHSNLYVRTDRGIATPADLAGKRVGLIDFQQTAALWLRGLLADDHGVSRDTIRWTTAGLHAPVLEDRMAMTLPEGIVVERSAATLDGLLRVGEIDAVISPTAPRAFADPDVPVARLWPDYCAQELHFWQTRQLFPIMHVLVVRRSLAQAHPGLRDAIFSAFEEARRLAAADLVNRDFPKVALPWLSAFASETRASLGTDPWTYGLAENRATLETMLRYAEDDGLTQHRLTSDALFE